MSQNPFSQKVKIYTRSATILILAAVLLRCINFLFFFDTAVDYFDSSPFHTAYRVLCILTVGWLLTSVIFIPRYSFTQSARPTLSKASCLTALFCAVLTAGSFLFFRENMAFYAANAQIYRLLSLFSLAAAAYFVLCFLDIRAQDYRVLLGYVTIFWLGLMLCATYLNLYVTMNSPFKITLHMAILGMMLHLIEEARLNIGRGFRITYLAFTLIGVLNCAVASIPVLLAFATGVYRNIDYLFYAILMLAFLLHLSTRAYDCYRLLLVTPQATPEEIAADQEKKSKEKEEKTNKKRSEQPADQAKGDDNHVR